ncbi:MAG: transporter [Clostridia bacterium]|jgi:AAA15 family ATPase/GTPase|nr:transporter [Clostridia bacterium]
MLIQFNLKNYKSFKEEISLDMTATSIKEHSYNLIEDSSGNKYLKIAAIYGANASGKSNLIDAFGFMRYFVLRSLSLEDEDEKRNSNPTIPISSFAFDTATKNKPSEFEVFLVHNNVEYQYGFVLDQDKIYEEWLYSKKPKGKNYYTLFERLGNKVECGEKMKAAEKFADGISDKTLFLTLTAKTKISVSKKVRDWFRNNMIIDFGDVVFESLISNRISPEIVNNELYKRKIEEFLVAADTGIQGIVVEKAEITDNSKEDSYEIFSQHKMKDGKELARMPFSLESSGTIKMFCLFDFLWEALNNGYVLFVDELNAKLHPLLVRYIINMFHDPDINRNNAQLIYTTHDTFTLTRDVFRRDEIWFAQKDDEGTSRLFSLIQYKLDDNSKIRNDASFDKDYIAGRYGAIPVLREFKLLEE